VPAEGEAPLDRGLSAMRSAAEPSGMVPWSRSVWSCTISSSKLALAPA
jgi:hypothetical protein